MQTKYLFLFERLANGLIYQIAFVALFELQICICVNLLINRYGNVNYPSQFTAYQITKIVQTRF